MLVVLDSNILISALISSKGVPYSILKALRGGRFKLATCTEQLDELRRASHYAKIRPLVTPSVFGGLLNHLQRAIILDGFPPKYEADDSHDSYLLNLAVAAEADYLVTGDKRSGLLKRRRIGRAGILTASSFCESVLDE
jgi:hypothetical protein